MLPDLAKAREFFTGVYGAKELPATTSRVLACEKELRFPTGATVFKCWAPRGQRESDTSKIPDVLVSHYVTHNVRDMHALHDALTAKGVEVASPLASHQGVASLFMVRGPGGALDARQRSRRPALLRLLRTRREISSGYQRGFARPAKCQCAYRLP